VRYNERVVTRDREGSKIDDLRGAVVPYPIQIN
jgi:hypothetical protein